jgi:thiamine pyrophosphokinase
MQQLTFDRSTFDAVVVLNGDLPAPAVFTTLADLPLIAADGAANALLSIGVVPEFIVGDLDSVSPETLQQLHGTTEFIVEPDQDSNDFEKTLHFARTQLWSRILVTGLHGGDLEHTLNNWSVLMRFARDLHLVGLDRSRYAIPVSTNVHLPATEGEIISLIPQPLARITTEGLHWSLTNEELSLGSREGARNRAVADTVRITVHEGSLLVFCDARLPYAP